MTREQLAAALFEYFSQDMAGDDLEGPGPFTFSADPATRRVSVDGEIYCDEIAKFILAKFAP